MAILAIRHESSGNRTHTLPQEIFTIHYANRFAGIGPRELAPSITRGLKPSRLRIAFSGVAHNSGPLSPGRGVKRHPDRPAPGQTAHRYSRDRSRNPTAPGYGPRFKGTCRTVLVSAALKY
ncbi:unnamed protein product, partial [Iphiclides podalirius]